MTKKPIEGVDHLTRGDLKNSFDILKPTDYTSLYGWLQFASTLCRVAADDAGAWRRTAGVSAIAQRKKSGAGPGAGPGPGRAGPGRTPPPPSPGPPPRGSENIGALGGISRYRAFFEISINRDRFAKQHLSYYNGDY